MGVQKGKVSVIGLMTDRNGCAEEKSVRHKSDDGQN